MSTTRPSRPGISHLVLQVRDIEASHSFYTDMLGFEYVSSLDKNVAPYDMRFYRGASGHHDVALIHTPDPDEELPVLPWDMFTKRPGIGHIALAYGTREAWLNQIEHLQAHGVEFLVRGDHGMTHSAYVADPDGNGIEVLYELPREVWEGDVEAALNYFQPTSPTGAEALADGTDYKVFGRA
jgi:catechol-2,3-dioxygenase